MLGSLMSLIRRPPPDIPDRCPSCDCRLPLECVGPDRFFCAGCGRDHRAVRDVHGDWQIDVRPIRHVRRASLSRTG